MRLGHVLNTNVRSGEEKRSATPELSRAADMIDSA